jgi:predicted dehydrogenase
MTALRVACVGTGFIAGRHLEALSGFADVDVVAVADPVRERAEEVAGRYGTRAHEDGLALLQEEELDAVWICVPPFAHGPLEQAAVDRGLPFFVEKPLARDLDTAAAIAERVRERGLLTGVGYHWRYLDAVEEAAAVLQGRAVQLVLGQWLDRTPAAPWWARRDGSGGQMLEQTTHLFDLARLLVGEVTWVSAAEVTVPRPHLPHADVATASTVTLRFSSGAIGTISSTCVLDRRHRVGLQLVAEGAVVDLVERGLVDHELRVVTDSDERVTQSAQDPIAREDRDFVDALRGKVDAVRVPYQEALRTQRLVWAADRSAREQVPVELPVEPAGGGRG